MLQTLSCNEPSATCTPADRLMEKTGRRHDWPLFPAAASKALAVASDPARTVSDFSIAIQADRRFAAGVLKMANSAAFWSGRTIDSLSQAVTRLGMGECQNLIITVAARGALRNSKMAKQCSVLWRHAFNVALISRTINRTMELGFHGEEYSAGLMHDVGRILFAIRVPEQFGRVDKLDFQDGIKSIQHEQHVLGTDHCALGAWFSQVNQLPNAVIAAIRFHHAPEDADQHQDLVALVAAADHMANHLARRAPVEAYDPDQNTAWQQFTAVRNNPELNERFAKLAVSTMVSSYRQAREMVTFS